MSEGQRRQDYVVTALRKHGELSVTALAEELEVSEATIRRDLRFLDASGKLVRTYGGAKLPSQSALINTNDRQAYAKRAIARLAENRLIGTASMVITGGSTTQEFASYVGEWPSVTVITNSLDIAHTLVDREGVELVIMGGVVRKRSHSLLGHLAERTTQELRADVLVMGIGAISFERGLMNDHIQEVMMDRSVCRMAREVYVLADSTKFRRIAQAQVIGFDGIAEIVTDDRLDSHTVRQLEDRGVRVSLAAVKDYEPCNEATASLGEQP